MLRRCLPLQSQPHPQLHRGCVLVSPVIRQTGGETPDRPWGSIIRVVGGQLSEPTFPKRREMWATHELTEIAQVRLRRVVEAREHGIQVVIPQMASDAFANHSTKIGG